MFPVFRSTLQEGQLAEMVRSQYALGDAPTCYLWNHGINDVYRISTPQGKWILRISSATGHSPVAVREEVDILRHLANAGIRVAPPIPRRDGSYVMVLDAPEGKRAAVLFAFIESGRVQPGQIEQAKSYGAALARMHRAAERYPGPIQRPPHDFQYFVETPLERLSRFPLFADRSADLVYLRHAAADLWSQAIQLPQSAPGYGLCHGDAMSGNALYGDDGSVTLIDFDFSGIGWRIYDLATYIWVHIINGPTLDWSKKDVFRALLNGYETIRPLSTAEFEALPVFAALRQFFLFGSAIRYAPAFGAVWMGGDWLVQKIEFIKACQDRQWLDRVGLR